MTGVEDDIRYWQLTSPQASHYRRRIIDYWGDITRRSSRQAHQVAGLAVLLSTTAVALAVWAVRIATHG